MRKRLAGQLDEESSVADHKRMRYSMDPGAGLADGSRSVVGEIVKRGRGRPRKVGSRLVIIQYSM